MENMTGRTGKILKNDKAQGGTNKIGLLIYRFTI